MKLDDALRMAAVCGLTTYGEAVDNVELHCMQIFTLDEINDEMKELYAEIQKISTIFPWRDEKIPQELIDEETIAMDKYFADTESQVLSPEEFTELKGL